VVNVDAELEHKIQRAETTRTPAVAQSRANVETNVSSGAILCQIRGVFATANADADGKNEFRIAAPPESRFHRVCETPEAF
jgi:hypothetical protein